LDGVEQAVRGNEDEPDPILGVSAEEANRLIDEENEEGWDEWDDDNLEEGN
jgi:hypothetical protein